MYLNLNYSNIFDNSSVRQGIVRVTEMLRQMNNEDAGRTQNFRGRKESESEEDVSASRRSSGADSGLGNLSENEILEHDNNRTGNRLEMQKGFSGTQIIIY